MFKGTPVLRAIAAARASGVPSLIWGNPGTGKTATLTNMLKRSGHETLTLIGSLREPVDFNGIPLMGDDGYFSLVPDRWVKNATEATGQYTVVLDELNTSSAAVMAAMLRLINEKFVGDIPLGDHVGFVAIANPEDIAVNAQPLPPPMANRFCHIQWALDHDSWLSGFVDGFSGDEDTLTLDELCAPHDEKRAKHVASIIAAYLHRNRAQIEPGVPEDPTKASGAWASPRTWTLLSKVLARVDAKDTSTARLVVNGLVGEGAGHAFMTFWSAAALIDPYDAMKSPKKVKWDSSPHDVLFSLIMSVATIALDDGKPKTWEDAMAVFTACAEAHLPDVAIPGVITIMRRKPEGATMSDEATAAFRQHVIQPKIYHRSK